MFHKLFQFAMHQDVCVFSERRRDKLVFYGITGVGDDINSGKYDVISYYGAGRM
jgi:hypothetical protein